MSTVQQTIDKYNQAIKDYPSQLNTIYNKKYSELLGRDNPAELQINAIKLDQKNRESTNKLLPLELEKKRLSIQQEIDTQQQNVLNKQLDIDYKLNDYLKTKTEKNKNTINTLQHSIDTRDKIIYTNNRDSYDKNKLVKTLLLVFLLVVVLSTLSMLYFFHILNEHVVLGIAVLTTVVFVYKIIRTYYWREIVHDANVAEATMAGLARDLVGAKPCPECDNTNYCTSMFNKLPASETKKSFCEKNPINICCKQATYCSVFNEANPNFCRDPNNKHKDPHNYYKCCEHQWPHGVAIINDNTDMNLLDQ